MKFITFCYPCAYLKLLIRYSGYPGDSTLVEKISACYNYSNFIYENKDLTKGKINGRAICKIDDHYKIFVDWIGIFDILCDNNWLCKQIFPKTNLTDRLCF